MAAGEVQLRVEGVAKQFGGVTAVDEVSLEVHEGEILSVIGPNGAGKTSLLNMVSGFYQPDRGRISFEGADITALPPSRIAELGIARTFQNIELFENASVLQNLLIGHHVHQSSSFVANLFFTPSARRAEREARAQAERVIELLDLQHHRDSLVHGLPYGVRKVVEVARALCMGPKLLLLDEPSSGLNVEETEDMAWWIRDIRQELGITVLMVEHDMSLVSRVSDRVLAMNQGEVLTLGAPAEVQAHPGVIEAYLGSADDLSGLRRK